MVINVHAGHNPDGKIGSGAVGLIKESTEARYIKDLVISKLRALGHTVYDCTVNDGVSQSNVLYRIVELCNAHKVDIDISIHFNSGAKDLQGNGKSCGTETWIYSDKSKSKQYAEKITNEIAKLGFTNRGVKISKNLYVLKKTKNPCVLIECCFVDDKDDCTIYNREKMASAIVKGITGETTTKASPKVDTPKINNSVSYFKKCDSKYKSFVDGLKSIGVNSSYTNRKKIALLNGISDYKGTESQNIKLLGLLKNGKLRK